jgi:2-iminoacetate synthase ThiH
MTYGRDTITLRDLFQAFNEDKEELKRDLEEYITFPAHSLELRWQMFKDAPPELSNHNRWIYDGFNKILDPGKACGRWIGDLDLERHTKMSIVDMVEEEFSKLEDYNLDIYPGTQEEDFLDKIKEQVLKDNIKSFIYDW